MPDLKELLKPALLRERFPDVEPPPSVRDGHLLLAHSHEYVDAVATGRANMREVGLPWSPELVERCRRSVGATLQAAEVALENGKAASLAGGTHHAFHDRGEGFCIFNDVAIALRSLRNRAKIRTAAVIDCAVHQGNGTAALLRDEPEFFTLSLHGANNFPFRKEQSDLDVALPDRCQDTEYLRALENALQTTLGRPLDLVVYVAGADPYHDDRFGRLALSKEGLARRDRMVYEACRHLPIVVVMAGGYARNIRDTVDIQARSIDLLAG